MISLQNKERVFDLISNHQNIIRDSVELFKFEIDCFKPKKETPKLQIPIPIGSVTVGIRAQISQPSSNSDYKKPKFKCISLPPYLVTDASATSAQSTSSHAQVDHSKTNNKSPRRCPLAALHGDQSIRDQSQLW
jgi:hypothetical protein